MGMNNRLLRPRASGFNPRSISGLLVWLDAADGSYNATTGTWTDKSGNNRNFTQSDVNNRPIISATLQNGKTLVEFDGTNDQLLASGNWLQIANCTLFAAVQRLGGTFGGIIASSTADNSPGILVDSSNIVIRGYSNISFGAAGSASAFQIFSGTVTDGATVAYSNGTQSDSDVAGGTLGTLSTTTAIGTYRQSAANFLNGRIGEIIAYNRVLTTAERQSVQRYLGSKFGVTIA